MVQCVYKISCVDENIKEFYIGSTDDLQKRIYKHQERYINYNQYVYKFIRENGGISNWEINPIEIFSFLTKEELRQHEQFYLDEYKPQLNTNRAYRTQEQLVKQQNDHYKNNKIYRLENVKQYYKKNSEKIKKYTKTKINCPHCNLEISRNNISRHIKKNCKSNSI